MCAHPPYRSQVLDHLGLVAAMFDELGIGDVIDQATQQDPQTRDLTAGEALKAMVLNGLGFVNQALYLVPLFFHNKPTYQLVSPRVFTPDKLNDDALGRTLDHLYAYGVTELYSLIAITAAKRLGLGPTYGHLDTTSFHVDGRYNSDGEPDEKVVHITQGYSRDHRPDLNQVMLELIVESGGHPRVNAAPQWQPKRYKGFWPDCEPSCWAVANHAWPDIARGRQRPL